VSLANIGKGDLVIGSPQDNPDAFELSTCHGHPHLIGLAVYELIAADGSTVARFRKQGFCLRDSGPYKDSAGESHGYNCDYQGITAGWEDIYDRSLDCQWLDVTAIPAGTYTLRVIVNPEQVFAESNYENNWADVQVTLAAKKTTPPPPAKKDNKYQPPAKDKKYKSPKQKVDEWKKEAEKKKKEKYKKAKKPKSNNGNKYGQKKGHGGNKDYDDDDGKNYDDDDDDDKGDDDDEDDDYKK
jgi:hypothetical protein